MLLVNNATHKQTTMCNIEKLTIILLSHRLYKIKSHFLLNVFL